MKQFVLTTLFAIMCTLTYAQKKLISLSFDDGPNTETTVKMLNVLKKHSVKASFFVIGKNIDKESAKVMQRAHKEGHDIENHSQTHSAMPTLTADSIKSEIEYTSAMVEKYIGERPQLFRPPYIAVDRKMFNTIDLPFICGEGCEDWLSEVTADMRVEKILASARDGLILLLHDSFGNNNTVEAVDRIIPILKKRGYEFVTVRQLFKRKNIKPSRGILYTDILHAQPWQEQPVATQPTKSLILYYSQTGATKAVAEQLQRCTGADIDSIVAEEPYTGSFNETIQRCQQEMASNTMTKLKPMTADIAKYDTIYLGYPVWFGTYARPMLSFIKNAKLDGKVIIPFCTFGSGGLNTTSESLTADQPKATILPGYGVRNARVSAMPKELDRFLKESKLIPGNVEPLQPYSEQKPVTDHERKIFDEACSDYQFPLGTPVTVGSRTTPNAVDYMFTVSSKGMDGKDASSIIYVTAVKGAKAEFTQVVR